MKVACPNCQEEIPPENVNVQAGVAYCPICEEGYSLQELLAPETDEPERTEEPPGSKVAFTRREALGVRSVREQGLTERQRSTQCRSSQASSA